MMRKKYLVLCCVPFILAGCDDQHVDLAEWMDQQGRGMVPEIKPIEPLDPYEPYTYEHKEMQDPFFPRKVEDEETSPNAPNVDRPKEPLEAYALDELRMVGTIEREKMMHALIQAPGKDIYQVTLDNHMGQNYGKIISITETEIQLKELVREGTGDWTERSSSMHLVESEKR